MRTSLMLLPALGLLGFSGCGELYYVEIDEPRLCVTLLDQEIPGVLPEGEELPVDGLLPPVKRVFDYDLSPALPRDTMITEANLDVHLLEFNVRVARGVDDFDFLDRAVVESWDEAQPDEPQILLAQWAKDGERAGPSIQFEVEKKANLKAALQKKTVRMVATMEGALPLHEWALDAEACFRLKGRVNYLE